MAPPKCLVLREPLKNSAHYALVQQVVWNYNVFTTTYVRVPGLGAALRGLAYLGLPKVTCASFFSSFPTQKEKKALPPPISPAMRNRSPWDKKTMRIYWKRTSKNVYCLGCTKCTHMWTVHPQPVGWGVWIGKKSI